MTSDRTTKTDLRRAELPEVGAVAVRHMQTWRRYVMHASAARKRKRELLAQAEVYDSMLMLKPGPSLAVTAMCWKLKADAARRAANGIVA